MQAFLAQLVAGGDASNHGKVGKRDGKKVCASYLGSNGLPAPISGKHYESAIEANSKKLRESRKERACCLGQRVLGEGRKIFMVGIQGFKQPRLPVLFRGAGGRRLLLGDFFSLRIALGSGQAQFGLVGQSGGPSRATTWAIEARMGQRY